VGTEGSGGNLKASVARGAGASAESFLSFVLIGARIKYGVAILGVVLLCTVGLVCRRRRQRV
jgi:hypothetical protein